VSESAPAVVYTAKTNSRSADEYTQPRSQLPRWLRGFLLLAYSADSRGRCNDDG